MNRWAEFDWSTVADLGKTPDAVIARRLGCSTTTVRTYRQRLGIDSAPPSKHQALKVKGFNIRKNGKRIEDSFEVMDAHQWLLGDEKR